MAAQWVYAARKIKLEVLRWGKEEQQDGPNCATGPSRPRTAPLGGERGWCRCHNAFRPPGSICHIPSRSAPDAWDGVEAWAFLLVPGTSVTSCRVSSVARLSHEWVFAHDVRLQTCDSDYELLICFAQHRLIRAERIALQRIARIRKGARARPTTDVAVFAHAALSMEIIGRM